METWIKLYSDFLSWEWFGNPKMVQLYVWLLLRANPNDDGGVKRGQLVTTAKDIMEGTGLSYQALRTCIARLVATNKITKKSTNKNSIITICDYDSYRDSIMVEQPTKQPTNENLAKINQPTNQQINRQNSIVSDCGSDGCGKQSTDQQPTKQPTSNQHINQQNPVVTDCGRTDCDKQPTDQQPTNQPTSDQPTANGGERSTVTSTSPVSSSTASSTVNNNINYNNISTTTTTGAHARAREESFVAEMKTEQSWLDAMAKNFGTDVPTIIARLDDFVLDMECRAVSHHNFSDARRHFNDWLRKRMSDSSTRRRDVMKNVNDLW